MKALRKKGFYKTTFLTIGLGVVMLFAQDALAQVNLNCILRPFRHDYMTQDQYNNAVSYVIANARWTEVNYSNDNWYASGATIYDLPYGDFIVKFLRVKDYYQPQTTNLTILPITNYWIFTNLYMPYSNNLVVTISGITVATNVTWTLNGPDEFSNASIYRTTFTNTFPGVDPNTYIVSSIPTGQYTVTFSTVPGFSTPSPQSVTTNIMSMLMNPVTATYTRMTGTLDIQVSPAGASNATWTIITAPADYAGAMNGTGSATFTGVPVGNYTVQFNQLTSWSTPSNPYNVSGLLSSGGTLTLEGRYTYLAYELNVRIGPFDTSQSSLDGIGAGSCMIIAGGVTYIQTNMNATWTLPRNVDVTLIAIPASMYGYDSFVYKWYEDLNDDGAVDSTELYVPSINFTLQSDAAVWLLFSREYYTFDNVGDIDQDGLPDKWEIDNFGDQLYGGPAENDGEPYGNPDNMDGDFIPNLSRNPPSSVLVITNLVSYSSLVGDAGYPLLHDRLLTRGWNNGVGYATGDRFDNYFECRGLDQYYKTNVPPGSGIVYTSPNGDDPMTNPKVYDTMKDGISDGWKYYFWYWRSSQAFSYGITNSANLTWVGIYPNEKIRENADTDGDKLGDIAEFANGTDPTHADTDGDGMDDKWEINNIFPSGSSNALDYLNWSKNPDEDYYAVSSDLCVLTAGMQGTAFTDGVRYIGAAASPTKVWVNIYTNTGANVFDLYQDTVIKADTPLNNREVGANYAYTVYYGTNASMGMFQQGYPVWVDVNGSGRYDAGDIAIVNPPIKHVLVYAMPPASPFPGVTSFDPRTAWIHTNSTAKVVHPNTAAYNNYQEYLGGDYLGRVSWDAGGRVTVVNDGDITINAGHFTDPSNIDTDGDTMEDGWELYVGLDPNNSGDAGLDPDGDTLVNSAEWANIYRTYANNKVTVGPTDPGVVVAPAPNDPHPRDTDWDGIGDALEATGSNPTCVDTDGDLMPDGWEMYAGTSIINADDAADLDGDGLDNFLEYWTGTVPEWQLCDATWAGVDGSNICFVTRQIMPWDAPDNTELYKRVFMPPDFLTDGSFMYFNGISTNVDWLRANYPATLAVAKYEENYLEYHTTLANNPDTDGDGMDDFWEAYHGLNPCKGVFDMMMPGVKPPSQRWWVGPEVDYVDADPSVPGFQFGTRYGTVFHSLAQMVNYVRSQGTNREFTIYDMIGPFNFGMDQMDADGDGLPNLEEYAYSPNRTLYHTDPTPIWRTDSRDDNSFVNLNYTLDYFDVVGSPGMHMPFPFAYEESEGFDTDNDGVGDYAEINAAAGELGNNPLDERNPIRNRALYLNGVNDFAHTPDAWWTLSESYLTRFCVEAWVKPDNPTLAREQVVIEKSGLYFDAYNPHNIVIGANFRLGITNGLPYVLYNGRGSIKVSQVATAQMRHRLAAGVWTHIAGAYDGSFLTVYVNGEASATLPTTELPVNGVNAVFATAGSNVFYNGRPHSIIVGARDMTLSTNWWADSIVASNNFAGCIDEARVWNGTRTQAEILSTKNRRIQRSEMTNSALAHYYSFDDVPDPTHRNSAGVLDEPVVPNGLLNLDTTMSFHPPINWWAVNSQRSTVYTGLNGSYNYIVFAADHVAHMSITPPLDDKYHFSSNFVGTNGTSSLIADYNNFANPYGRPSVGGDIITMDLLLFRGARGVATNSWLPSLDPNNPDATDSDGDGLPDWWEQKYGLDPMDPNGVNGAWGDADHDGLNNRAEYLAGTDPRKSDTYGTGVGDYDSPRGIYSRTYGEMYTDGDGMPDDWEVKYGLNPLKNDAALDLDGDGWSNYQEFMASTDPSSAGSYPRPRISGTVNYYGNKSGTVRILGYHTNAMDGVPQTYQYGLDSQVSEVIGYANGTLSFSGILPFSPVASGTIVTISAIMYWLEPDGSITYSYVTYTFTGPSTFTYSGRTTGEGAAGKLDYNTGEFTLTWARDEVPFRGNEISVSYGYVDPRFPRFSIAGFKEGDVYLMAYMDVNNDQQWTSGEPLGIARGLPFNLEWSNISDIRILLVDNAPGFGRFAWTGSSTLTNSYPVIINKLSESGAPTVLRRSMGYPRNYLHEWDFQRAGIEGLTAGTYQWWMGSQNGTFHINWPTSLAKPVLVYPRGDTLHNARNQFAWTMDLNCPMVHVQVARQASNGKLAFVTDKYIRVPWMDNQGVFYSDVDEYASEWGSGIYYWRVAGWTPQGESAWSDQQTFDVNLSSTNSRWIDGDIMYFGKVPATRIIVEAFDNRGFSGLPVSRVQLTPSITTNVLKAHYVLQGLQKGAYYVRAFIDTTPVNVTASDGKLGSWESWGFVYDPENFYQPGHVLLSDVQFVDGATIIIRDRDTDNDKLPDAWEMAYFGNMDQTGDMDYDGDGESNLDEYIRDGVNLNPASWDSDGDGLSDEFELKYNGAAFGFAPSAVVNGLTLNPTTWDTDGDGYSDGAELLRYHTDPMNAAAYPRYLPNCTDPWSSPGDYDGDGRSDVGIFDSNSGVWSLVTMAGHSYNLPFGIAHVRPLAGDFDGDGLDDFTLYDAAQGIWNINTQKGLSGSLKFGDASMSPVPADYNGDGRTELAAYDNDSGIWYIYNVWDGQLYTVRFGSNRMIPVPGDYNNDGAADLAVYEPATGKWMFACRHKYYHTWQYFNGVFGGPGWMPVSGDYDGDGRNDVCLFEGASGRWQLYTWAGQYMQATFGWPGCVPAPGDYDGDGRTDAAIYDTNTGMWYIICWSGAYYQGRFGGPGLVPILKDR